MHFCSGEAPEQSAGALQRRESMDRYREKTQVIEAEPFDPERKPWPPGVSTRSIDGSVGYKIQFKGGSWCDIEPGDMIGFVDGATVAAFHPKVFAEYWEKDPGMKTHSQAAPWWFKLATALLRLASNEFRHHSCNDFNLLKDGGLTQDELADARAALSLRSCKHEIVDDSRLMDVLADMFEHHTSIQPSEAKREPAKEPKPLMLDGVPYQVQINESDEPRATRYLLIEDQELEPGLLGINGTACIAVGKDIIEIDADNVEDAIEESVRKICGTPEEFEKRLRSKSKSLALGLWPPGNDRVGICSARLLFVVGEINLKSMLDLVVGAREKRCDDVAKKEEAAQRAEQRSSNRTVPHTSGSRRFFEGGGDGNASQA